MQIVRNGSKRLLRPEKGGTSADFDGASASWTWKNPGRLAATSKIDRLVGRSLEYMSRAATGGDAQ